MKSFAFRLTYSIAIYGGLFALFAVDSVRTQHLQSSELDAKIQDRRFVIDRSVAPLFNPDLAAKMLDTPERDGWQQPALLVKMLHLRPGSAVADIGAGSGYLMPYLSKAVGPYGNVYEEEIQTAFIPRLQTRASQFGNVRVVIGSADNPRLPRCSVDCLVLLTVYHEVQDPIRFLRTLHTCIRSGGRLAIIDFDKNRKGSPPGLDNHWVLESSVVKEARRGGWEICERKDAIKSQFFLIFRPIEYHQRDRSGRTGF